MKTFQTFQNAINEAPLTMSLATAKTVVSILNKCGLKVSAPPTSTSTTLRLSGSAGVLNVAFQKLTATIDLMVFADGVVMDVDFQWTFIDGSSNGYNLQWSIDNAGKIVRSPRGIK